MITHVRTGYVEVVLRVRLLALLIAGAAVVAACGSSHGTTTTRPSPPASAPAQPTAVDAESFGMHVLGLGSHPYPQIPFGAVRVWDMGVTWKDLQPTATTSLTDPGSNPALARLDTIVKTFTQHHAQPMITLGMTPDWAARQCNHVNHGQDWGLQTCAPKDTSVTGPWGLYVKALATRYHDSVTYFETWNEPTLANGYNDDVATLAQMQQTAYTVLHSLHYGQQLVSPGIPFTNGPPTNGVNWLSQFFGAPGGTSFDIVGLHLYPSDAAVRAGDGPEWANLVALPLVRQLLDQHGLGSRPVWNTETNVGRAPAHTGYKGTDAGAAAVARTYILGAESHLARTFWYAADDRTWGGTWLENADFSTLTAAGRGYATVYRMLQGRAPLGCTQPQAGSDGVVNGTFTCRFGSDGKASLVAVWTTAGATTVRPPAGMSAYYSVTGARHGLSGSAPVTITGAPVYFVSS
jgi:hypothetical protein